MFSKTLGPTQDRPLASRLCVGVLYAAADGGIRFAAGRAAVKPACRFRQARGLRRRSEYGSSVRSQAPPEFKIPAAFFSVRPIPPRSVSELKPSVTNAA